MYIGHKREDGAVQPLKEHLQNVSMMAGGFGRVFDAEDHARRSGLLHDAGKYSKAGQRRMSNPRNTPKVDHSTAGAKIAWGNYNDRFAAFCIAGHHGGMPDMGGKHIFDNDGTLYGRLQKDLTGDYDYSSYWTENSVEDGMLIPHWLIQSGNPFAIPFYTRMLFSCLVDADFLDTERFMRGEMPRGNYCEISALFDRLQHHIQPWLNNPTSEINRWRSRILQDCLCAGNEPRGLYTLTVPTGGGKTVSSMAFALEHAVKHGMDRVIYVIPYTSIIEQNAAVFKAILGDENVIEHHSGVEYDENEDMENMVAMRQILATENWDAPVIITTAVQFFESLFSNKPSRCRKLHNIANSVIIFDEVQMLPLPYLKPCVSAIAELVSHYHSTAVLCTATQPALNRYFNAYSKDIGIREICEGSDELRAFFRRVSFVQGASMDSAELATELAQKKQVLCIVNTRKIAQEVFSAWPVGGSYHLSTRMTPDHRSKTLEEIRARLRDGKACRVVSTSLIEAGVDVDFPEVWREMAGLDSILQAAGRCNREGRRSQAESKVVVFSLQGGVPRGMQANATAAESAMQGVEYLDDPSTIQRYFEMLYWQRGEDALDVKGILKMCPSMELKSIAEVFRLIESDTYTVYIPTDENSEDLKRLRDGDYSRSLMRRLGRSAVSLYSWDYEKLRETGVIDGIAEKSAILNDMSFYDPMCGLKMDSEPGRGIWL